jgi:broad specificity phosphatase PhoE
VTGSAQTADTPDFWAARIAAHGLDSIRDCPGMRRIEPSVRRFIFLRHGETDGNLRRVYQSAEISLNGSGREQASFAAGLLKNAGVARVVASNMQRAWETASIVGESLGMSPQPHAGLRERWFGDLIGTSSVNLNWRFDPPNGERVNDFVVRTLSAFEDVLSNGVASGDSCSARTLIIAHGGNLYALAFSLGVELKLSMIQNATPLEFNRVGDAWQVNELGSDWGQPPRHRNLGW